MQKELLFKENNNRRSKFQRELKFRNIMIKGAVLRITTGRMNTKGKSATMKFESNEQCEKEAEKLISECMEKGYIEKGNIKSAAVWLADALNRRNMIYDETNNSKPGIPAKEFQLKKLENEFGGNLPPGYADFLRLHNGWNGISGGFNINARLLSIEDRMKDDISNWMKKIQEQLTTLEVIPDVSRIFVILFDEGDASNLAYIDRSKSTDNGEYEIISFNMEDGEQGHYRDFFSFLMGIIEDIESEINEIDIEDDDDDDWMANGGRYRKSK